MTIPLITNLKPGESSIFSPTDPIYISVRDEDSRLSRASSYALSTFSLANYLPDSLLLPNLFFTEETTTILDVFSDAAPVIRPTPSVDQRLDGPPAPPYGPVYVMEKAINGEATERGTLFVSRDVVGTTPVGCEIQFSIQAYNTGATSYLPVAAFTGIVAGFIHWPSNSGVFLFFMDDGGTRSIICSGPAGDAAGTLANRTDSGLVLFDWLAHPVGFPPSYRVLWDDSGYTNKVYVMVTDEDPAGTREEILLWEMEIPSLGTFLESVRLGEFQASSSIEKVSTLIGIDNGLLGDFIEVHSIQLETFGIPILAGGLSTSTSIATRKTSDYTIISQYVDTDAWDSSSLEGRITDGGGYFTLTQDSASAALGNSSLNWQESDLLSASFLCIFRGAPILSTHSGSHSTGAGLDISDGTRLLSLRFLDDFTTKHAGILTDPGARDTVGNFDVVEMDWLGATPEFLVLGSIADAFTHLYGSTVEGALVSEVQPLVEGAYPLTLDPDLNPGVRIGFLDQDFAISGATGISYTGVFSIVNFLLLPKCTFYYPRQSTALPAAPWTTVESDSISTYELDGERHYLAIDPSTATTTPHDEFAYYSLLFPLNMYLADETGITILAKLRVVTWWDQHAVEGLPGLPISPVVAIDVGDDLFLQMQFIQSTSSDERFVFFSQDSDDYLQVLDQTEIGLLLSTPIDFTETHVYQVSYSPGSHIRLYIDYSATPVIDIPWEDKDAVARQSHNTAMTSASTSIAFGSISEASIVDFRPGGVSLEVDFVAVSLGSGFDFTCNLSLEHEALEDNVYGAQANVFVDVTDMD